MQVLRWGAKTFLKTKRNEPLDGVATLAPNLRRNIFEEDLYFVNQSVTKQYVI